MVMYARSVSTSYASFEAELEGSILQSTVAVDYYLTQAPKWSANLIDEHATPQKLHSVFIGDMNTSFWQAFTHSRGEISLFDDSPYHKCGPCPPVAATDAYKATQLLRNSSKRRPRIHSVQGEPCRLEQYLQQDLQRYMDMCEELDSEASGSHAAVLSVPVSEQVHTRTSSSSSFVRLPEMEPAPDDEGMDDAAPPLAPAVAVAAAAAMAAAYDAFSVDGAATELAMPAAASVAAKTAARLSWDSSTAAATTAAAAAASAAQTTAHQQPQTVDAAAVASSSTATDAAAAPAASATEALTEAASGPADAAAVSASEAAAAAAPKRAVPFRMEDDEEIAAQKLAAKAKLAELEGEACPAAAAPLPAGKAAGKCFDDDEGDGFYEPGNVHSSRVPQRPRALSGLVQSRPAGAHVFGMGMSAGKGDPLAYGSAVAAQEAARFFQIMVAGLVLCMVLLPALWSLQSWTGPGTSMVHTWVSSKVQMYGNYLYLPMAAAVLLYIFKCALMLRPPLLHFSTPELEERYLMWSNSGKLFVDSMFQVLFLVIGGCLWLRLKHTGVGGPEQAVANTRIVLSVVSMMGTGLPMVVLLLLRCVRYAHWRETLLAGSRVASILALLVMQYSLPPDCSMQLQLSMPFVALAQLMGIACMQVRIATFVPCQVLHLLALLLRTQTHYPLLHFVQLFGGGLCLPCLLLHSMELYSRKAFLANFASVGGKQKVV